MEADEAASFESRSPQKYPKKDLNGLDSDGKAIILDDFEIPRPSHKSAQIFKIVEEKKMANL